MRIPVTRGGEVVGSAVINLQEGEVYADIEISDELTKAILAKGLTTGLSISYAYDDKQIHIIDKGADVTAKYPPAADVI